MDATTDPREQLAQLLAAADAATDDPAAAAARIVPAVLASLADAGGAMPYVDARALVEDLAGHHADAVLVGLLEQPNDRRRSPSCGVGVLAPGGPRWLWLERSGYRALGSSAKGGPPSPRQADHRDTIRTVCAWFATAYTAQLASRGVSVQVSSGGALRATQVERKAAARDALIAAARSGRTTTGGGLLLGGVYPDGLVTEAWPSVDHQPTAWPHLLSHDDARELDHAVAIEVELHRKAREPLTTKVRRHEAAATLAEPPYWSAVLWVVSHEAVATQLLATIAHVHGQPLPRTGHYIVPSHLVGGPPAEPGVPCWWPMGAHISPEIAAVQGSGRG